MMIGIFVLTAGMALTGCAGPGQKTSETAVSVSKNGTIQSYISETFEQNYYDKDEMQQMILSEVASYNRQAGNANISVEKVEVKDAQAIVQMSYASAKDYAEFNQVTFFLGTPEEAQMEDYDLNTVLSNVKNPQETIGEGDILAMKDARILITDTAENIDLYGKVLYASDNVTVSDNRKSFMILPDSDKMAYIILEQ